MAASITTLCYISIDRYIGICKSSFNQNIMPHPKYIVPIIWLTVIVFFTPMSLYCKKSIKLLDNSCECSRNWPSSHSNVRYHVSMVIIWLIIPFSIMAFCYTQILRRLQQIDIADLISNDHNANRKRGTKLLVLSTTMFFISWFPYGVLLILRKLQIGNQDTIR